MQTYRTEITISNDGTLLINDLPFQAGDKVEVFVRNQELEPNTENPYPLRNTLVQYLNPFDSVVEDMWNVLS